MSEEVIGNSPTRTELIKKILWNYGGGGFGLCEVANSALWALDEPGPNKPDLISIVALSGPPEKYTDQELALIVAFAERATTKYDKMCRYRRGANLFVLDKMKHGDWLRKRLSWTVGPMFSATLEEAIAFLER